MRFLFSDTRQPSLLIFALAALVQFWPFTVAAILLTAAIVSLVLD